MKKTKKTSIVPPMDEEKLRETMFDAALGNLMLLSHVADDPAYALFVAHQVVSGLIIHDHGEKMLDKYTKRIKATSRAIATKEAKAKKAKQ